MPATIINSVGALAALCSVGSFVPQAVKIWRSKTAAAVSLRMYVVTTTGFVLWTAYGALLRSWPLLCANAASLAISSLILVLTLRYSRRDGRPRDGEVDREGK